MIIFKKKQMTIAGLIVLICVAGYLNWSYKSTIPKTTLSSVTTDETEIAKRYGEARLVTSSSDDSALVTSQNGGAPAIVNNANYFADAKVSKEKTRGASLEMYKMILNNKNSDLAAKTKAQQDITALAKKAETENTIESLIKAKGMKDAIVFLNDENINVIVGTAGLSASDTAKIQDIVMTQTKISIDKIKILQIKK